MLDGTGCRSDGPMYVVVHVTRFLKHVSVVFKATDSHSIERVLGERA